MDEHTQHRAIPGILRLPIAIREIIYGLLNNTGDAKEAHISFRQNRLRVSPCLGPLDLDCWGMDRIKITVRAADGRYIPEPYSSIHDPLLSQYASSSWGQHFKCDESSSEMIYDDGSRLMAVCKQL